MRAAGERSTIPDAPLLSLDFTELSIMKIGIPKAELKVRLCFLVDYIP